MAVARRARELGFTSTIGILHDGRGQLRALAEREMKVYEELKTFGSRGDARVNALFQDNLARGKPNDWSCRAGSRYLYVDEEGIVHYCSQMRGVPGIPLEDYSRADLEREYGTKKACAPYCTINCVQRVAVLDNWRSPQTANARLVAKPPAATAPAAAAAAPPPSPRSRPPPAGPEEPLRGGRAGPGHRRIERDRRSVRPRPGRPRTAPRARRAPRRPSGRPRPRAGRGRALAVTLDLARPGAEDELAAKVSAAGIDVDLLVNNAGVGHTGHFHAAAAGPAAGRWSTSTCARWSR